MLHVSLGTWLNDELERGSLARVFYLRERIRERVQWVVIKVGVVEER